MGSLCLAAYLVVASIFSAAQSSEPAQAQGHIIGSVVNDSNEPVGHAILCTSVVGTNSAHTECGAQRADADGHFDIRVPLETNRIFAENPQAGYQEANNPMEQGVHVKLSELEPVANITIKIGPSPAEIILDVTDRSTGKPVSAFVVRWMRIDDGPVAATDSNKSRVLVPPNVELILTVRSPGYERWFYTDVSAPSRPILRLASGERKTISVELEHSVSK
jgi:hypothetical protein